MKPLRGSCIVALAVWTATTAGATRLRVTGDRVNLRAIADPNAEVVTQVSTGESLQALSSLEGAWIQVVPPSQTDLWIFAELVQGAQVIVSKAQVRAGAGLNFNVVGSLRRGATVQERGRLGDWLRIAPPEGTSLWVSRDYVEPMPGAGPEPSPPPPSESITPIQPVVPASPAPPARRTELTPEVPRPPDVTPPHAPDSVPAAPPAFTPPRESATEAPARSEPASKPLPAETRPSPPAAFPATPTVLPPPVPAPSAGWESPAPSPARPAPAPSTSPPQQWTRPRVLIPRTEDGRPAGTVGPANIPADRLSPRFKQARPGRYEGQLSRAGAIFFTPGKYRLVAINRSGRAVTVCYVLGNERQLAELLGSRVVIEGSVYWFRSTQYPTIHAERLQRLP